MNRLARSGVLVRVEAPAPIEISDYDGQAARQEFLSDYPGIGSDPRILGIIHNPQTAMVTVYEEELVEPSVSYLFGGKGPYYEVEVFDAGLAMDGSRCRVYGVSSVTEF